MVYQDLPHHLRGQRKEVCAVLPIDRIAPGQAQISFMDESCWLQGVIAGLTG